jgi:hypothetical protein
VNTPLARAGAQLLVERDAAGPESVARRMLAVQGQAFGPARWALGARSVSTTLSDVDALFDEGTLVRTWTMRGTLHIVGADDVRLMLTATADKQRHLAQQVMRRDGMDAEVVSTAFRALETAMSQQGPLERKQAMDAMSSAGLNTDGGRGYHLIREAALAGIVVWGPVRRTQQALVPAGEWLPPAEPIGRDEAITRILTRYLQCRSPATLRDFAWWLGITLTEARRAHADAGDAVVQSDAGPEFLESAATVGTPVPSRTTALLPAYDEYILGYRDRSPVLEDRHWGLVQAGANGIFQPVIVLDGRVAGTWRADASPAGIRVDLAPFVALSSRATSRIEREAARYANYLGTSLLGVSTHGEPHSA